MPEWLPWAIVAGLTLLILCLMATLDDGGGGVTEKGQVACIVCGKDKEVSSPELAALLAARRFVCNACAKAMRWDERAPAELN